MRYATLPGIERRCSAIGLGLWGLSGPNQVNGIQLGWPAISEEAALSVIASAAEAGITVFDTSDFYGNGRGEALIAASAGVVGADAIVCTKGGLLPSGRAEPGKIPRCFEPEYIDAAIDASLKRLCRGCIDIYFLHGPTHDALTSEDLWRTLERRKRQGDVTLVGISMRRSGLEDVSYITAINQNEYIDLIQGPTNPSANCSSFNGAPLRKPIVGRSPYAHGMLMKGSRLLEAAYSDQDHRSGLVSEPAFAHLAHCASVVETVATEYHVEHLDLLLHYALANATTGICMCGATTSGQIKQAARSIDFPIDATAIQRLAEELPENPTRTR